MKQYLFFTIFFGFLFATPVPVKANLENIQTLLISQTSFDKTRRPHTVKFVSYNIQLSGLDESGHLWQDRKYAVCTLLSYADIFALQEISHEQLKDIEQLLPAYQIVGINTVNGKNLTEPATPVQEGLAIGFRKDIFNLLSNQMIWYSDTPSEPSQIWGTWTSAFPKALQKVTINNTVLNLEIDIFNSHFAHDEDPENMVNPRLESSKIETDLLKKNMHRCWISAGDRNFHYPRDIAAYEVYNSPSIISDSRNNAATSGTQNTFLGYEDHPRVNPITAHGDFEKTYYLDVVFHNPNTLKSTVWLSHIGEYDEAGNLLPFGLCKQKDTRLFASDHCAIFVSYELLYKKE